MASIKTARAYLEMGPDGWFCVALVYGAVVVTKTPGVVERTLCWAEGTEEPQTSAYLPKTVEVREAALDGEL